MQPLTTALADNHRRVRMGAGDDEGSLQAFEEARGLFSDRATNRLVTRLSMARIYDRRGDFARARPLLEETLAMVPPQLREHWAATASELGVSLTLEGQAATWARNAAKYDASKGEPGKLVDQTEKLVCQ